MLIAGIDDRGPQMYYADPSGTFFKYKAKALGSGSITAQSTLEEAYNEVRICINILCAGYLSRNMWYFVEYEH